MKSAARIAIGGMLMFIAGGTAFAVPPGPGQHFDCSDGGDSSCATDDPGCVSNTTEHLYCSRKIARALAKAAYAVTLCHAKQATQRFNGSSETGAGNAEENCEENPGNSAKQDLDDVLAGLQKSGRCDATQLSNAAAQESALFDPGPGSLDAKNGSIYCDATSGTLIGDDDAGYVPVSPENLKCAIAVAKNVAKFTIRVTKCHEKMNTRFFKGYDFDEKACEDDDPLKHKSALEKYNVLRDKLLLAAICPSCLDQAGQDQLAADALAGAEAAVGQNYPCGLP